MLELLRQSLMCFFFFFRRVRANRRTAVVAQQTVTLPLLLHCRLFEFMWIEDEHSRYGNYRENSKISLLYVDCHRNVCGSRSPSAAVLWIFRILRSKIEFTQHESKVRPTVRSAYHSASAERNPCGTKFSFVRRRALHASEQLNAPIRTHEPLCAREIMGKKYCMRNPSAHSCAVSRVCVCVRAAEQRKHMIPANAVHRTGNTANSVVG